MKRFISFMGAVLCTVSLYAMQGDIFQPDMLGNFRLTSDDGITVSSVVIKAEVRFASTVYSLDGIVKADVYDNLVAKSTVAFVNATISTMTLATGASTFYLPENVQPTVPRNVQVGYCVGESSNSAYGNVTIVGLNARGQTITEVVFSTANGGTQSNNAFAWITSYTLGAVTMSADIRNGTAGIDYVAAGYVKFAFGTADKIGFRGDLDTSADFLGATVQTNTTKVQEKSYVTVNYLYDTWTHSDVPDGADDFYMYYISHIR